ncbi:hypothetical protein AGABI1DRAFT_110768 [Agaricus bisporus var. burnettii JB137-S8]|uniref:DRBM domain-containing protein n=2 Tax=Agaricus bisporus var. burnettii TaxID=192524 RepID=K5XLC4_AGABU|nr:uncharacterized protein AGABI1DRAFT_110768 [Agaricus bisporus var. burnettii JB137-S8]EKM84207.1 hypothetical protein AGABI1DRAFT_110768 [Agaricus bisporus var. burnettii JB137-S8]KAF7784004.1 hypothetical protein Agabi119p4_169 [Agaricus bisporus var. burnettii]
MQHAYPPPTAVFSPPLKRNRSGDFPRPPAEIPPLPDLRVEFTLEVFTHESIRPPNAAKGEGFADNTRLTVLGERVLGCAVTSALFKRRPPLSADDLIDQKKKILDDSVIMGWVTSYQLVKRILCKSELKPRLHTPKECRKIFCAYVGAVFCQSGQEGVGKWVESLVRFCEQIHPSSSATSEIPPAKKVKNEPVNSSLSSLRVASPTSSTASSMSASSTASSMSTTSDSTTTQLYSPTSPYLNAPYQTYPARQVPPHMSKPAYQGSEYSYAALLQSLTSSQSSIEQAAAGRQPQRTRGDGKTSVGQGMSRISTMRPNPLAPATPNAPFLPLFNQTAAQRGVKVDYSAEFSGPSHAGQWTVQCIVNNIPKGTGKGSSKQIAKEEAARQAYYSMGWT